MRSRYSGYVEHDVAYLLRTWHPATRPASLDLDPDLRWVGLEIVACEAGGSDDTNGVVEFRAHHRRGGETGVLHEVSRFRRQQDEVALRPRQAARRPESWTRSGCGS